ncbi:hypothetical protein CYMTET_47965 [Cymbomonas tetramitiformis]|uniref:Uncharacterized protein n=1 Tax=Cymbomonas tetramitiformis TaxID=36881 RepID=A0AAE0EVL8_9CHLO|nr:hypothetical protein CYMTET_47965 [Cymbomonas tetramitiformis]
MLLTSRYFLQIIQKTRLLETLKLSQGEWYIRVMEDSLQLVKGRIMLTERNYTQTPDLLSESPPSSSSQQAGARRLLACNEETTSSLTGGSPTTPAVGTLDRIKHHLANLKCLVAGGDLAAPPRALPSGKRAAQSKENNASFQRGPRSMPGPAWPVQSIPVGMGISQDHGKEHDNGAHHPMEGAHRGLLSTWASVYT